MRVGDSLQNRVVGMYEVPSLSKPMMNRVRYVR